MSYHKNVDIIFSEFCSHLVFDQKLAKQINSFKIAFENKNEDHMTFFGGNLTGVQVVRFTVQDKDEWFGDILGVNDLELEEQIITLPTINQNFHVSSDLFNLSAVWLVHKFMTSSYLDTQEKHDAMIDVLFIMNSRFLTGLLGHYFKLSTADPEVAAATYSQLSYKFALKQCGSWRALLLARSEEIIKHSSIHYKTFERFNNDFDIVYTLNDCQGRIRDILKNIYAVFKKVHTEGGRISVTKSTTFSIDGEEIIKDKTKNLLTYTRYINSIVSDKDSFIKEELISIIEDLMHTMPARLLKQTLLWCTANYNNANNKDVETLIDTTLIHSFTYLQNNRTLLKETNDISTMIVKMRGVYMSSRSSEVELISIRELSEKIVRQATTTKNDSVIASVRTALLLYIVLRAYSKSHYA